MPGASARAMRRVAPVITIAPPVVELTSQARLPREQQPSESECRSPDSVRLTEMIARREPRLSIKEPGNQIQRPATRAVTDSNIGFVRLVQARASDFSGVFLATAHAPSQ